MSRERAASGAHLSRVFGGRAWHGPSLKFALKGWSAEQALWSPGEGVHNTWELALHCAFWKLSVARRLGAKVPQMLKGRGRDFPSLPAEKNESSWRSDRALLGKAHEVLEGAVAQALSEDSGGAKSIGAGNHVSRTVEMILGIAAHDTYHAGQIMLLKRSLPSGDA